MERWLRSSANTVTGERRLRALLAGMNPRLEEGEYVFCSVDEHQLEIDWIASFREAEGLSLVVPKPQAEAAALEYAFTARMIKLDIHSSLEAVGFLAAIAARMAEAGISLNPVSASYHDYLFVPTGKAEQAMRVLRQMMREAA